MVELKPCPFCGSSSMSMARHDEGCFIRLYFEDIMLHRKRSPEEYEAAWNARADDQSLAAAYRQAADYWRRMYEETVVERTRERTCHVTGVFRYDYEYGYAGTEYITELSCGHHYIDSCGDVPDYCPWCGAKVMQR